MTKANSQVLLQKSAGEFLQECSIVNSRKNALEKECTRHHQGIREASETIGKRVAEINTAKQNCGTYIKEREELAKRWRDFQSCVVGYKSRMEKSKKLFHEAVTQVDDVTAPHIKADKEALKQEAQLYKLIQEVQELDMQVKAKLLQEAAAEYDTLVAQCASLAEKNITSDEVIDKGLAAAEENKMKCDAACDEAKQRNREVHLELRTLEMEEAAMQQLAAKFGAAKGQLAEENDCMALELRKHEDTLKGMTSELDAAKANLQDIEGKVAEKQVAIETDKEKRTNALAAVHSNINALQQEISELSEHPNLLGYERDTASIIDMDKAIKEQVVQTVILRTANSRLAQVKQAMTAKRSEMEHQYVVLEQEMKEREQQKLESQLRGKEEVRKTMMELHKRQFAKKHYEEDTARGVIMNEEEEARSRLISFAAKELSRVVAVRKEKEKEKELEKEKERSRSKELQRSQSRNKPQKRRQLSVPDSGRTPLKVRKFNDMFKESNNSERSAPSDVSSLWYDARGRERSALKKRSSQTRDTPGTRLEL
eukprot:TRINITY_DN10851_c0_g1_i1.p1 TRINITY_DN10851_c0_g1~~TRINITY_DN10851_c0_g1_i1.p1  ORF type:complete len:553 (+),score=252.46 TRINITY_DN10851_c0_g1_i1:42-1661(+)